MIQSARLAREKVAAFQEDPKGVEITLRYHSGHGEEGSVTRVSPDGRLTLITERYFPLLETEKRAVKPLRTPLPWERHRQILGLFANDEVLRLPREIPALKKPKGTYPREMRYSIGLRGPGIEDFEAEHPHFKSSLEQSGPARRLIRAIQETATASETSTDREDREFLGADRVKGLLEDGEENVTLELNDIQGLWGGTAVRISDAGTVNVFVYNPRKPPAEREVRSTGKVPPEESKRLSLECMEMGVFDIREKRRSGIPDEVRPTFTLKAVVKGEARSRSIALWDGEAKETPAFEKIRRALREIGANVSRNP